MTSSGMRIAILTHSTNPRGGVSHSLALAESLETLGHHAVAHAPDPSKRGFFRMSSAATISVSASIAPQDTTMMVRTRIAEYVAYFEASNHRRFDIFHAQDGISGNALATLKQRGLIPGYVRTVHHIDNFEDAELNNLQRRSIAHADQVFVVSRTWADTLRDEYDVSATIVGNGVDLSCYSPHSSSNDKLVKEHLHLGQGPIFLSVGGIEERKNTSRILQAFAQIHALHPTSQLVIVGGASVLNHNAYQNEFSDLLRGLGLPPRSVLKIGPTSESDLQSLYRIADVLVFASVREGFGLVVLEAMASGLPVVTSRIPPFIEYLSDNDAVWCDPFSVGSIANAMGTTLNSEMRAKIINNGFRVANAHSWRNCAQAHLPIYEKMRAPADA